MAFRGEFEHKLDSKHRLTVPADYREELSDGVVLVRGMDFCIEVYPTPEFERARDEVDQLPSTIKLNRTRQQVFNAGIDMQLDPQGRVTLPAPLRRWARMTDNTVTVCGNGPTFRIWDPGRWDDYLLTEGAAYADMDTVVGPGEE